MADNETLKWILDLDNTQFSKAVVDSNEKLSTLAGGLDKIKGFAYGVAASWLSWKTIMESIDLVKHSEQIDRIGKQYELLTKQLGINGAEFEKRLKAASAGLIDETDLIGIANKAMIEFQEGAVKLPEVLELARKITQVYGGELKDNFEALDRAIASGQTRALKSMGIFVNADKAVRDFAASHGMAASAVTEHGRQMALLDAVLTQGNQKYKNIDQSLTDATAGMSKMKAIMSDLYDTGAQVFDRLFGSLVRQGIQGVTIAVTAFSDALKSAFSIGAEHAAERADILKQRIIVLQDAIDAAVIKQREYDVNSRPFNAMQDGIDALTLKMRAAQAEYDSLQAKVGGGAQGASDGDSGATDAGSDALFDSREQAKADSQAQEQIMQQRVANEAQRQQLAQSAAEADAILNQQKLDLETQTQLKIAQMDAQTQLDGVSREEQKLLAIENMRNQQEILEGQRKQREMAALDEYERRGVGAYDSMDRSMRAYSMRSAAALSDWGARGKAVMATFQNNAVSALEAWGAGHKSASEAAKGFLFGFLGDRAIAEGTVMMMSGVWPPNPVALAGGAALIAFGGFLKSQAGGGGSSPAVSTGGGGDIGSGNYSTNQPAASMSQDASNEPRKSVQLVIQGHVFNNEATATWLTDIIRQADDMTDFKVQRIGG